MTLGVHKMTFSPPVREMHRVQELKFLAWLYKYFAFHNFPHVLSEVFLLDFLPIRNAKKALLFISFLASLLPLSSLPVCCYCGDFVQRPQNLCKFPLLVPFPPIDYKSGREKRNH